MQYDAFIKRQPEGALVRVPAARKGVCVIDGLVGFLFG